MTTAFKVMGWVEKVADVLAKITYKNWEFRTDENCTWLQVRFVADGENWGGRKWPLSTHMTRSEIVQTALKAVLTAEEHEAREQFRYRGEAIFGPHINVDAMYDLLKARGEKVLDPRPEA